MTRAVGIFGVVTGNPARPMFGALREKTWIRHGDFGRRSSRRPPAKGGSAITVDLSRSEASIAGSVLTIACAIYRHHILMWVPPIQLLASMS